MARHIAAGPNVENAHHLEGGVAPRIVLPHVILAKVSAQDRTHRPGLP